MEVFKTAERAYSRCSCSCGHRSVTELIDPLIFGKIIDDYALNPSNSTLKKNHQRCAVLAGCGGFSRRACAGCKSFPGLLTRLAVKKFGMQIFNDGLKQTLRLSYDEFEEQRSGETLSVLQKVRDDTQIFMNSFINVVFSSVVGMSFLIGYSLTRNWLLIPVL